MQNFLILEDFCSHAEVISPAQEASYNTVLPRVFAWVFLQASYQVVLVCF